MSKLGGAGILANDKRNHLSFNILYYLVLLWFIFIIKNIYLFGSTLSSSSSSSSLHFWILLLLLSINKLFYTINIYFRIYCELNCQHRMNGVSHYYDHHHQHDGHRRNGLCCLWEIIPKTASTLCSLLSINRHHPSPHLPTNSSISYKE